MSSKKIDSILDNHAKILVPYTAECEYRIVFMSKYKDNPLGVPTIYHSIQVEIHHTNRKLEKDGCKFRKIDKLTIIKYKSEKKLNPLFYKIHVAKRMLVTKILHLIHRTPDNF